MTRTTETTALQSVKPFQPLTFNQPISWRWFSKQRAWTVRVGNYYFWIAPEEINRFLEDVFQMRLFLGNQGYRYTEDNNELSDAPLSTGKQI